MLSGYHISTVFFCLVVIIIPCRAIPNLFSQIADVEWKLESNETGAGDFVNSTVQGLFFVICY